MFARSTTQPSTAALHTWWGVAVAICLVGGFLLGRLSAPEPADKAPSPDNPSSAKCIKVLDGDTIRVIWQGQEEDVRILGIDCPETRRSKKLTEQAEELNLEKESLLRYGNIAKKTTQSWLLDRQVDLVFPSEEVNRDSFGRLLAYVEEQGVDIGERLLSGGNAFLWDEVHPRQETYILLEAEAKKNQRGVWRAL